MTRRRRRRSNGQGLVEFALGITIFLTILIGLIDLARAAWLFNGVSDAAREIARVTSVHPGTTTLGGSSETATAVSGERALVPGLSVTSYTCIDISGATVTGTCQPGDWVRVQVKTTFRAASPLLIPLGAITLSTASSAKI